MLGGSLQCWGLPAAWGPSGHWSCGPLTWHPSALSAVNLDHFQILRAIGKGSFGKVRLRMGPGWTCVGKAGRLGLVERVGMLPAGQASDAGASGGLPLSPPLLSSPSPGLWVLVARLGAGGADGASLGSSGAKTLRPFALHTSPILQQTAARGLEGMCLRSRSMGGQPPTSGAQRPGLCWSLQVGRGRTQVAAMGPCPTLAPRARSPLSLGRIQAPDCSLILPRDWG